MRHDIPIESLGAGGAAMAGAIESCVHCGFCLPTCPTYRVLQEEMDSPRGRIVLMKGVLEGGLELDAALPYVDRCLGCLACVTACPSGVEYGELLTAFRGHAEERRHRPVANRAFRAAMLGTLPYPGRAAPLAALGTLARPLAALMPEPLRTPLELLPRRVRRPVSLPALVPAQGPRRARVALLAGCVQQVVDRQIDRATVRVLARNGVEVVVPRGQSCCGAIAMHTGDWERARTLARRNLEVLAGPAGTNGSRTRGAMDAVRGRGSAREPADSTSGTAGSLPGDVDAIVTNAAGCGAGMREYGLLFDGEPEERAARAVGAAVRDVSAFLDELGLAAPPPPLPAPLVAAYHDACHLAHAQGIRAEPRRLLRAIPNLALVEPAEWELCCGSAGTYNLEQPAIAGQLGRRKAANLEATGAGLVVAGNVGCLAQLRRYTPLPMLHTMQLLDGAYRGRLPAGLATGRA